MFDFLRELVEKFVCWVQTGIVLFFNALIVALGAIWGAIIDVLPEMPDYPDLPSWAADAARLLDEIVDVPWLTTYMASFLVSFLLLLGVMALLRWIRATD